MSIDQPLDTLICQVQEMDSRSCINHLRQFTEPRLDFSDEFLSALSEDRLRHLLMAACIQARRKGRPRPQAA